MNLAIATDPLLDQLGWMMWTRVVPIAVLAMLVGLTIRYLIEWTVRAVVLWWFGRRSRSGPTGTMTAAVTIPAVVPAAPPCPACARPMVRRTARRGASAGQSFWGCSGYPACRGTRPVG